MTAGELYTWPARINDRWTLRLPAYRAIRYEHEQSWEKERIASMALNLGPGDVLFDVGAESGDMSALFTTWLGDRGGIVLIEPNPKAWPGIRFIWEANALRQPLANFVAFCAAAPASAPADDVGGQPPAGEWPACAFEEIDPAQGFRHLAEETDTTPSVTVDHVAALYRPTALTIDVEGAELEVLKGARRTLEDVRPLIWVSIHPQFMRHHFGQTPADLKRFVRDFDYEPIHLGDDHESHYLLEPR